MRIAHSLKTLTGLIAVTFLGGAASASAGNSTSGGGFVYGDQLNPWFLENVATVTYCIDVDPDVFHVSAGIPSKVIAMALGEWKRALQNAGNGWYDPGDLLPYGQVRVGTQRFVEQDCSDETDLRFQLGRLTDKQRPYVADPSAVIATTVRTHYDEKALRGKGFIYVAADTGSWRPVSAGMVERPWEVGDGTLLLRVLLHELGHVFGLQHFGGMESLMGMQHPELVVQKSTVAEIEHNGGWQRAKAALRRIKIFGFDEHFDSYNCNGLPDVRSKFFGIPASWGCFGLRLDGDDISIWGAPDEGQKPVLLGKVARNPLLRDSTVIINVKITEKQRVFTKVPEHDFEFGYLRGPGIFTKKHVNSIYQSSDGAITRPFKAEFKPEDRYQVEGILDGNLVEVIQNG